MTRVKFHARGRPAAGIMAEMARADADRSPYAHTGRNDPCPCGSGRKFKKCHGATEQ